MKIRTKKRLLGCVAAASFVYAIGVVGGISNGMCSLASGCWRILACMAVMAAAAYKAGVLR